MITMTHAEIVEQQERNVDRMRLLNLHLIANPIPNVAMNEEVITMLDELNRRQR
jgi:hypothetical protein